MEKYVISADIFESDIYLFIGERNEFVEHLEKKYNLSCDKQIDRSAGFAFRFIGGDDVDYGYAIWIEKFDYSVESYPVLAHECLHIADFMLKDRQIKETEENNEILAYTFDFIFRSFLKKIKNKRSKNGRKKQNKR